MVIKKSLMIGLLICGSAANAIPETPIVHKKTNSQPVPSHPSVSEVPAVPTAPEESSAKSKPQNMKAAPLLVMVDGNSKNILDFEYDKNGNPTRLLYETQDGKTKEVTKFTMKQLESEDGAALGEEFGVVGLAVRAKLNSNTGRGQITFKFVNDGSNMFSLKHRECSGTLVRSPQTKHWEIFKAGETKASVKSVELVQWSLGLTTLKGLCPSKYDKNDPPPEDLTHSPAEDPGAIK